MSKLSQAQFVASTKTTIVFGRELTTDEYSALKAAEKSAVIAGHQVSPSTVDTATYTYTTYWSDLSDAEAYVAVANGFDPAPTSVTVDAIV